jgi:imidazolonepropionase-like amidohydrolase
VTNHINLSIRRLLFVTSLLSLLLLVLSGHIPDRALAQEPEQPTAFVNVNVIPLDTERVLENQTVIVEGEQITSIGPANEIQVPDNAEVIQGNGTYLMPGLADMHTHLGFRDPDPRHLILYPAEGTTTVRSMSGSPTNLEWRDQVERGELNGPTIYTAGSILLGTYDDPAGYNGMIRLFRIAVFILPLLLGVVTFLLILLYGKLRKVELKWVKNRWTVIVGVPVLLLIGLVLTVTKTPSFATILPVIDGRPLHISESPAQAASEVRSQHEQGFDFVKPYDSMTEEAYLAAIAEANKLGMYAAGHAIDQASLETVMTSGINELAHIGELNFYHWNGFLGEEGFSLDYDSIPETVALMKENNVNIVSNLVFDETLYRMIFDGPGTLAGPEYWTVRPELTEQWLTTGRQLTNFANQGPDRKDVEFPFFKTLIKAIQDAGVIVTIGSDTGQLTEGSLPTHIHRELEILVEAGFSNYEALEAGTKNASYIVNQMGRDGSFGTVEVGQRADLLLLEQNPLENVSNTRNRVGVMARGQWFTQAKLDEMVDQFVATYQKDDSAAVTAK